MSLRAPVRGQPARGPDPREYALLEFLALHPGQAFTRAQLLDRVWGPDYEGTERTVDRFVTTLRQRIERDPATPNTS